jgi:NAD(P)H-dependent FMN reductase
LALCGSLQAVSANRAAVDVVTTVAVAAGATVDVFDRLGDIPAFDAEAERGAPIDVIGDWRRRVRAADVVVVAAPEYAGGLAGAVKNAFDWLVGSGELYRKPIAVMSAGTSGGWHARRQMAQTVTWQGAYVVAELGIAAPRSKSDASGRFTDETTVAAIASLTHSALATPDMTGDQHVALARRVLGSLDVETTHVTPAA